MELKYVLQRHWRWIAIVLLVVLSGLIAWNLFTTWRLLFDDETSVEIDTVAAEDNALEISFNLTDLPKWHLFGQAPISDGAKVPDTRLQLNLLGIMQAGDPQYSQAIISAANGESKVYGIDDELPGGAKLKQVLSRSVIIERDGELEKLALPVSKLEFAPPPSGLAND